MQVAADLTWALLAFLGSVAAVVALALLWGRSWRDDGAQDGGRDGGPSVPVEEQDPPDPSGRPGPVPRG